MNVVTVAEIKRRGMAAIEEGLQRGVLHILKRNRPAAVVMSEEAYRRMAHDEPPARPGVSALQWLLSQPVRGQRSQADMDAGLQAERASWDKA